MRVDHGSSVGEHFCRVELAEERLRLAEGLAGSELARRPLTVPARVVAGEHAVGRAVLLFDRADLERTGDPAVVAEKLVKGLRAEREEWKEERLERVDRAQRDEEHRRGAVAVGLDDRPRGLVGEVLVRERARRHRLGERGSKAGVLDVLADRRERALDRREQCAVGVGELAGLGHGAEIAVRVHERPVDEIAPVREQLVVRAADELLPREVAVLRLGARRR